jgi:hypothetical protein
VPLGQGVVQVRRVLVAPVLAGTTVGWPATTAIAGGHVAAAPAAAAAGSLQADFNHDSFADLAVGVPRRASVPRRAPEWSMPSMARPASSPGPAARCSPKTALRSAARPNKAMTLQGHMPPLAPKRHHRLGLAGIPFLAAKGTTAQAGRPSLRNRWSQIRDANSQLVQEPQHLSGVPA